MTELHAPANPRCRDDRSYLSFRSKDSILSIGSVGSVLSVGSVGSALCVASIASSLSLLSAGSWLSTGSLLSARSSWSVLSWRSRDGFMTAGILTAALALHAIHRRGQGDGAATRRSAHRPSGRPRA